VFFVVAFPSTPTSLPFNRQGTPSSKPFSLLFVYYLASQKKLKTMGVLKQLAEYLYLRKPDPDRPKSQWIKYMHGINRISILLFILALVILFIKLVFIKK
jgi:hypothetical protein